MSSDPRVEKWQKGGLMTPNKLLPRANEEMKHLLSGDEHQTLQKTFDSISLQKEGIKYIDREAFIALLAVESRMSVEIFSEAGNILFDSFVYLSSAPFKADPGRADLLTFDGLERALIWILPNRSNGWLGGGTMTRQRTKADQRRMVFQSLATERGSESLPFEMAKKNAKRRAFDLPERLQDFAVTNFDNDGDEMYHDILDVLYNVQPAPQDGPIAPVQRNDFKSLAATLHDGQLRLRELRIPRTRLCSLVKMALSLAFEPVGNELRALRDFEESAESVVNAFDHQKRIEIDFDAFDHACTRIMPGLFYGIHRLISKLFTKDEHSTLTTIQVPPSKLGSILNLPRMSQLATFLSESLSFDWFQLSHHYSLPAGKAKIQDFAQSFKGFPDETLILISGCSIPDSERHIYGVWIPSPSRDGIEMKCYEDHWQPCAVFQLLPVQDLFHGCLGKPAWQFTQSGLWFGHEMCKSGVALGLLEGLDTLKVEHRTATGGDEIYQGTAWRGDWGLEMAVEEIEVWKSMDPQSS